MTLRNKATNNKATNNRVPHTHTHTHTHTVAIIKVDHLLSAEPGL